MSRCEVCGQAAAYVTEERDTRYPTCGPRGRDTRTNPPVAFGGDFSLLAYPVPGADDGESYAVYDPAGVLVGFLKRWNGPGWQAGWVERLTNPGRPAFFPWQTFPTLPEGAAALVEAAKP